MFIANPEVTHLLHSQTCSITYDQPKPFENIDVYESLASDGAEFCFPVQPSNFCLVDTRQSNSNKCNNNNNSSISK